MQADKIELKVSKDDIISSINQTPESISINAARINLTGYVTAEQLNTTNATISNLVNGTTMASSIQANRLYGTSFSMNGHAHNNSTITIEGINYHIVTWT